MMRNLELGILHGGKLNESGKGIPETNKFDPELGANQCREDPTNTGQRTRG